MPALDRHVGVGHDVAILRGLTSRSWWRYHKTGSGIGEPVKRREDVRPLTGHGRYDDDWNAPGKVLAQEFGRDGIRVNAVSPGMVRARA